MDILAVERSDKSFVQAVEYRVSGIVALVLDVMHLQKGFFVRAFFQHEFFKAIRGIDCVLGLFFEQVEKIEFLRKKTEHHE
jgi:hypothetical protein